MAENNIQPVLTIEDVSSEQQEQTEMSRYVKAALVQNNKINKKGNAEYLSKMITKLRQKYQNTQNTYLKALLTPFDVDSPRLPSMFPIKSATYTRNESFMYTVKFPLPWALVLTHDSFTQPLKLIENTTGAAIALNYPYPVGVNQPAGHSNMRHISAGIRVTFFGTDEENSGLINAGNFYDNSLSQLQIVDSTTDNWYHNEKHLVKDGCTAIFLPYKEDQWNNLSDEGIVMTFYGMKVGAPVQVEFISHWEYIPKQINNTNDPMITLGKADQKQDHTKILQKAHSMQDKHGLVSQNNKKSKDQSFLSEVGSTLSSIAKSGASNILQSFAESAVESVESLSFAEMLEASAMFI